MATITYTRIAICAGGCHVTMDVAFNGGVAQRQIFDIDLMRQPFSSFEQSELDTAKLLILKAHIGGKTRTQIASEFQPGVAVTVTL